MSMSKTTNTYNRQNWEDSEFPILCQTCLGDNPYVRMIKERYGKECKICTRPFTIFRWCPGARMRFKKTEICQTCAKLKNVCQTCLLDLEYGLPIQVRDAALKIVDKIPQSDVNKEYYIQKIEAELQNDDGTSAAGTVGKSLAASDMLTKLARTQPYYKRNQPHICSFWVKGECKRGEECPYRHDKPNEPDDPLSEQNIRDRYYGKNDPVADKILKRAAQLPTLDPPEDKTITTLYVGNISEYLTEKDIRDNYYQYGEIRNITMVPRQQCSFVQFTKRASAEAAAEKTFNKLVLGGQKLSIKWAHSQAKQSTTTTAKTNRSFDSSGPYETQQIPIPPAADYFNLNPNDVSVMPPGMKLNQLPPSMMSNAAYQSLYQNTSYPAPYSSIPLPSNMPPNADNFQHIPPPPINENLHYPSQDPNRLGAIKK